MRRFFHISALILLYLVITAKSCDNQEEADEARNQTNITRSQDSIRSTFESDTLSNASLRAFEVMARIKLSDFNDYLIILNDTSVAELFREKAREMIRGLFINENSVLALMGQDNSESREFSVKQLLHPGKGFPVKFGKIITDSIKVRQSLQRAGDAIYTGKLGYAFIPAVQKTTKSRNQEISGGTINFLLAKHDKQFGTDTLKIWDVFLGDAE